MEFCFKSIFIMVALFLNCNSDSYNRVQSSANYNTPYESDLLSFEMSFASELSGTKDDFLLIGPPFDLYVKNNEDILLIDENKIKVYNKLGKGIKLIGRRGKGPGEFGFSPELFLGPKEYMVVLDNDNIYNLYSSDYTFIEKKRFQNNQKFIDYLNDIVPGLKKGSVKKLYPFNRSEKVYQVDFMNEKANVLYTSIVYEDKNTISELINCKKPSSLLGEENTGVDTPILGLLVWDILPDRRIVYINTDDDEHSEQNGSNYTVHIISIDTHEETKIKQKFIPYEYSEDLINSRLERSRSRNLSNSNKALFEKYAKILSEKKYNPSIINIKIDGYYAFIYVYRELTGEESEKIDNGENIDRLVDVFDLKRGIFLKQVVFPGFFGAIKNGFAYESAIDKDGFAEIRKYKINQSVYEKWKNVSLVFRII